MQKIQLKVTGKVASGQAQLSVRAASVAAMFGIPLTTARQEVLFENVELDLGPGEVVLITGPSGAGKSTLLRKISAALQDRQARITNLAAIEIDNGRSVVDCFSCALEQALAHLSRAGLSEAHVLLRSPAQLSEGQQFRYRLARFFASDAEILIADEFCATLDRVTAKVVAHQLGKFIRTSGKCAIVATTHEDLAADLRPAIQIYKCLGKGVEMF